MKTHNVASMFAGIGGICTGFKQAGFNICWANEKDMAACRTYRHNFGDGYLVEGDVRSIDLKTVPEIDVLTAGFPCQSFSIGGAQRGFADTRGTLFFEVTRAVEATNPAVIFLENVENLMEHDNGRTFQVIYASLVELGYIIHYRAMPSHKYAGIPQTRRRIYIVAFRDVGLSEQFHFPDPVPCTTRAMDWLNLHEKKPDIYYYSPEDSLGSYMHRTVSDMRYVYRVFNGATTKLRNGMCPTLTASMNSLRNAAVVRDNYGVRRLTLKECLAFQGFPGDFYFPNSVKLSDAYAQIGNSVTVPIIERIAKEVMRVLT